MMDKDVFANNYQDPGNLMMTSTDPNYFQQQTNSASKNINKNNLNLASLDSQRNAINRQNSVNKQINSNFGPTKFNINNQLNGKNMDDKDEAIFGMRSSKNCKYITP